MLVYDAMTGIITFVAVIVGAGVIALVSFLIYRFLNPKFKQDKQLDEKEALEEELNRVLEPIDDDEVAKEIAEYVEDDE